MRNFFLIFLLSYAAFCLGSCEDDAHGLETFTREGYILGFHNCHPAQPNPELLSAYLVTENLNDTLLTFDLPKNLFEFPEEYLRNYRSPFIITEAKRNEFSVKFTYSITPDDSLVYVICPADRIAGGGIGAIQIALKTIVQN